MTGPLFLKLGGSLITDKTGIEVVREDVLRRVASEIALAKENDPELALIVGHGSGSFGHVAAAKYDTRSGVSSEDDWRGFAEVSDAAARLNRLVVQALLEAGVSAITIQPSGSAVCDMGRIVSMAVEPVRQALEAGIVPVVYGDVAFDLGLGGTIISTEEILIFLAAELDPPWLLLAGETAGVLGPDKEPLSSITPSSLPEIAHYLGGSRGTDVTGGMAGKVQVMLNLISALPALQVRIFSGLQPGLLYSVLQNPATPAGTVLRHPG
ncbi:MAG: isopentenyl phosphate kinase [Candidatus Promineifilaceae bacterium]